MADPARARKLAKRIATIVATAIDHEIKDPRLAFVTVTDVKMTGDLHEATIFYTVRGETLDSEPDYNSAAAGLEKAKGALRTKVGAGTGVRFTPSLTFAADTVPDTARSMEELLQKARTADLALARARENAKPAGDPDPYREPRVPVADSDTKSGDTAAGDTAAGDTVAGDTVGDTHSGGAAGEELAR